MRKITEESIDAFLNHRRFKRANTEVVVGDGYTDLCLHNNIIAKLTNNCLYVSTAGWNTNTTRDRLNGIPGVHVRCRNGRLTLNGEIFLSGALIEVTGWKK